MGYFGFCNDGNNCYAVAIDAFGPISDDNAGGIAEIR
jgi:Na+/H+-translocating membrane pyrophosphatase